MLAKIKNNQVVKYPYEFADLQQDNPYTNFGSGTLEELFLNTEENLAGATLVEVTQLPQPQYDSITQNIEETAPALVNSRWQTNWSIVDVTPEVAEQRLANKRMGMVVTPFQAKAALAQLGKLEEVETIMQDPATSTLAKLAWNEALEFRRTSPTLLAIAQILNTTDAELDNLFEVAGTIVA